MSDINDFVYENQFFETIGREEVAFVRVDRLLAWQAAQATPPAAVNQQLLEALELCFEHCKLYHREVVDNNVGVACRAAILAAAAGGAK